LKRYNYFKWCNEDNLDEKGATIRKHSKNICDMERAMIDSEKRVNFLVGIILFLGLINIILVSVLFKIR